MGLNIILCGQRAFGAAVYDALTDAGHQVAGVISPRKTDERNDPLTLRALRDTRAWAPAGQPIGRRVIDALATDAHTLGAHLYERRREHGGGYMFDVLVAAHSHDFVSRPARHALRIGAIGYHPSLLPRHRGRSAIDWTIRDADPIAGGTVYWLDDRMDAGDIAANAWCWVRPGWDAKDLWRHRLFPIGVQLLTEVCDDLLRGEEVRVPQDEALATFEPALNPPRAARADLPELPAPGQAGARSGGRVIRDAADATWTPAKPAAPLDWASTTELAGDVPTTPAGRDLLRRIAEGAAEPTTADLDRIRAAHDTVAALDPKRRDALRRLIAERHGVPECLVLDSEIAHEATHPQPIDIHAPGTCPGCGVPDWTPAGEHHRACAAYDGPNAWENAPPPAAGDQADDDATGA